MMKTTLLIGLGSFIGGSSRYLIWKFIYSNFTSVFPFGTFIVNLVGCFLIGVVLGWSSKNHLEMNWQLFLTTGILGGFTTFSAFSLETVNMIRSGQVMNATLYVTLSLLLGILCTFAGFLINK